VFQRTIRGLLRSSGYSATAVVSMAVALALATVTFAFVDSRLNPPSAWTDPDQVFIEQLRFGDQRNPASVGERKRLLETIPGIEAVVVETEANAGEPHVQRLRFAGTQLVPVSYWRFLGVPPLIGRTPTAEEARARSAVVISERLWRLEYPEGTPLNGATLKVGDRSYDVVGVMPHAFTRQISNDVWFAYDGTAAIDTLRESAYTGGSRILVRLKSGVTVDVLDADLRRVASVLTSQSARRNAPAYQLNLRPAWTRRPLLDPFSILLYVLAFGILAIGCTNVAALTLARGISRRREHALHLALGASRGAIARRVLGEVGMLTLAASVLGVGFTFALLGVLRAITPLDLLWGEFGVPVVTTRTFVFCGVAILAAIATGAGVPAWRASRVAPNEPLKDLAGTTTGRTRSEFRILVVAELAIAMVLLMMASLASLSVRNMLTLDFGFAARSIVTVSVAVPERSEMTFTGVEAQARGSVEAIRQLPGVQAATLSGGGTMPGGVLSSDRSAAGEPVLQVRNYRTGRERLFATLGVRMREGRDFVEGDAGGDGAAILSNRAAKVLFPRGDAIGRRVKFGAPDKPGRWVPVVGVSEDFLLEPVDDPEKTEPMVAFSFSDSTSRGWSAMIRASGSPAAVATAIRERLTGALPGAPRIRITEFARSYGNFVSSIAYVAKIVGALGVAAVVLGALGLFSVLSYAVGQRSREFAVRVALGATEGNLVSVVMRSAIEFTLAGTAIGALLSFWASAGMSRLLFGVKNTDPVSLVITEVTLIAICLLAALAPALRASRANPLDIIRAV
jgi:putative ABC transport system permease protein